MTKENWERKLFYLLTPALMGDPFTVAEDGGDDDVGVNDDPHLPAR
jgi:hypothetical protein